MGVVQKSNMKCINFPERSKKYYFSRFLPVLGVKLHSTVHFYFRLLASFSFTVGKVVKAFYLFCICIKKYLVCAKYVFVSILFVLI